MNHHYATYRPTCSGYHAMVRLPRDGFPKPIIGKSGKPVIYATALAAQEAATRALEAYLDGNLRRAGETLSANNLEAERVFSRFKRRAHAQ